MTMKAHLPLAAARGGRGVNGAKAAPHGVEAGGTHHARLA